MSFVEPPSRADLHTLFGCEPGQRFSLETSKAKGVLGLLFLKFADTKLEAGELRNSEWHSLMISTSRLLHTTKGVSLKDLLHYEDPDNLRADYYRKVYVQVSDKLWLSHPDWKLEFEAQIARVLEGNAPLESLGLSPKVSRPR